MLSPERKAKPAARRSGKAPPPLATGPDDELVSAAQLPALGLRFSRNWLRELCWRGEFPAPFRLTPRRVVWRRRELEEWIVARERASERHR